MIFAGDFAQLPPPGRSPSLYSQTIGTVYILHTVIMYKNGLLVSLYGIK